MNDFQRYKWQKFLLRISIPNLMTYVVLGMAALYVVGIAVPEGWRVYSMLSLTRAGLMRGEVWRLLTFVFLPPSTSIMWIIFTLYFYWIIGTTLQNQWGSARFTLFYLVGMLFNIIAALIFGYADNTYLNLSLFFAFAAMNPNFQLMIFFVIPVKVKYLAILDAVLYVVQFIMGSWATRLMIVFSLLNVILFLGGDIINGIRRESHYWKTRYQFKKAMWKR